MTSELMNKGLLEALIECAEKNKKAVDTGDVESSISTAGVVDGMALTLRCLKFGAAVGIVVKDNGCQKVQIIQICRFAIWNDGKFQPEEYEKAINYFSEG